VYATIDPISKKRLYLRETVPAGPNARRDAEKVRTRLLNEVYERRNPRTDATVAQLIDRHIAEAKLGIKTRKNYRGQPTSTSSPASATRKSAQSTLPSPTRSTRSCAVAEIIVTGGPASITLQPDGTTAMSAASPTYVDRSKSRASSTSIRSSAEPSAARSA